MPYRESPPFSLTFKVRPPLSLLLSWAFSARRRSSSACISDSLIVSLLRFPAYNSSSKLPGPALFDRDIPIQRIPVDAELTRKRSLRATIGDSPPQLGNASW